MYIILKNILFKAHMAYISSLTNYNESLDPLLHLLLNIHKVNTAW